MLNSASVLNVRHAIAGGMVAVFVMLALGVPSLATETVVVTASPDTSDPCLAVAGAKAAQWTQTPLWIRQTRTFGDGSSKDSEAIFTVNQAYAHWVGKPWNTVQFLVPQRRVRSVEVAAERMHLAACTLIGPAEEAGQQAHLYAVSYRPDDDGSQSTGRIWIADATGLPLRQEMDVNAAHPDVRLPVKFAATYAYGDDVRIPMAARQAEYDRRSRTQSWVKAMQDGRGYMGL